MNTIELALKKQLLELEAAAQREVLARHIAGLMPLFDAADQVGAGVRWIKRHPETLAAGLAFLVVVRPSFRRFVWRWGRRSFVAWRLWRDSGRWISQPTHT